MMSHNGHRYPGRRFGPKFDSEFGTDFGPEAPGRGSHRGGGRFFRHGALRLVLLSLIAEKPAHGYELIKAIEEKVGGAYSPSPGVLYPALGWLEAQGYTSVTATEDGRKLYSLTETGQAFLEANAESVQAALSRLEGAAARSARPPQIVRAIENLKTALRLRLHEAELTDAQAEAIADILDKTAKDIERTR